MFEISLPWSIGPLPIFLTLFSIFFYLKSIYLRQPGGGGVLVSAFLIAAGLFSLIVQAFVHTYFFGIIIFSPVFSALSGFFILQFHNFACGFKPPKPLVSRKHSKSLAVKLFAIFILLNFVLAFAVNQDPCTITKCYAIEMGLGRKSDLFAATYICAILGGPIILVVITAIFRFSRNSAK